MQLPEAVQRIIAEQAGRVAFRELKQAAAEMSDAYRQHRTPQLDRPEHVAAYLVTRMPATYAAAERVLCEVRRRLCEVTVTSVLDVGAGSGATSLAAQRWFATAQLTLLERNPAMVEKARLFLPAAAVSVEDFTRREAFAPHDLVIASYALGEAPRADLVSRLWAAARVALVVIEPGSRQGFAFIRQLRERLLASGAHMLAPCPSGGACPMAAADWCHFAARVERTSLHRRLKEANLNYEDEKFSYVAVSRFACTPAEARIIQRPLHRPGVVTLEACTPSGLVTLRVPKREREPFRAARAAGWGDEFPHPLS